MKKPATRLTLSEENRLISEALEDMVLSLRVEAASERTIEFYVEHLAKFQWWLKQESLPQTVDAIEPGHIRMFVRYLQTTDHRWGSDNHSANKPLTESAVHAFYRALRAFFNWCQKEDYIEFSPFADKRLKAPKMTKHVPEHYDNGELNALLDACKSPGEIANLRDKAILLLLLDAGLRASELCDLDLADVAREKIGAGRIMVNGKGRKERYVPVSPFTEKAIREYIRKERGDGGTALFVGRGVNRLTYDGLRSMLRRRARQAGIEDVKIHKFRHSFAMHWTTSGGSLHALQSLLGHTTPTMSMWYGQVASSEAIDIHRQLSPVESLTRKARRG